jgi:hypothetical protein
MRLLKGFNMNGYLRRLFYLISLVVVAGIGTPFQPHSAYAGDNTVPRVSSARTAVAR